MPAPLVLLRRKRAATDNHPDSSLRAKDSPGSELGSTEGCDSRS